MIGKRYRNTDETQKESKEETKESLKNGSKGGRHTVSIQYPYSIHAVSLD
jgi:hypothetical protein